uniref:Uncharacterized protein n=1 Tax=Lactuca sativa TaxID=4236 RepID=A0A9R1UPC5_LACSA|nr:hypothetical protein LSAT_V11C800399640 [Lactuca sativa]
MSWPEYLPSLDELNYEANEIHTNNASQDNDNEILTSSVTHKNLKLAWYKVFNSRQQLIDWVQNMGRGLGYVIVIIRSTANSNIFFFNVIAAVHTEVKSIHKKYRYQKN